MFEQLQNMKPGDTFTIAGHHPYIKNPDRHWWTPWRPRRIVDTSRLTLYTFQGIYPPVEDSELQFKIEGVTFPEKGQ